MKKALVVCFVLVWPIGFCASQELGKYQLKHKTIDGLYANYGLEDRRIGIFTDGETKYFRCSESAIVKIDGIKSQIELAKRGSRVFASYDNIAKEIVRLSFISGGSEASAADAENKSNEESTNTDGLRPARARDAARTTANTTPRTEARSGYRSGATSGSGSNSGSTSSSGSDGRSAAGKSVHVGPRGGVFHFSDSGKKVYHSRK